MTPLQIKVLHMFEIFDRICEENGLRYFAIGGTAIGTVRHEGYIPWDDDMDLAMPRDDYKVFCEIVNTLLPEGFVFTDHSSDPCSPIMFGKIVGESTTAASSDSAAWGIFQGVSLDIMPLDGVPRGNLRFRGHMAALRMLGRVNSLSSSASLGVHPWGHFQRLFYFVGSFLNHLPGFNASAMYTRIASRYKFDSSKYLARTWQMAGHDGMQTQARYFRADFDSYVRLPFETTTIRMPTGYDRYLSAVYPNYMELPPEESRLARHSELVDLEHSFRYYVAKESGKTIGYTAGCFDLFHIGHLNILRSAKQNCDFLIVGVNSDEAMFAYKHKYPVVPEGERLSIVKAIKYVDEACLVSDSDKVVAFQKHRFDVIFVGSDHVGEDKWIALEEYLADYGATVKYFGYTQNTSSSQLRHVLDRLPLVEPKPPSNDVGV